MRILAYSHDSFGLGHFRRSVNIARAVTGMDEDTEVLLVTGSARPDLFALPERTDVLKLPGFTKDRAGQYVGRNLSLPKADLVRLRAGIIRSSVRDYRPDAVIVDHTPIGLGGELLPALRYLERTGDVPVVLGMRDVLDAPAQASVELGKPEIQEALQRYYQGVVVYGHPHVCDLALEYGLNRRIADKVRYVGVACNAPEDSEQTPLPAAATGLNPTRSLLITVGGGEDGAPLLRGSLRFLRSKAGRRWHATIVLGPYLDAAIRTELAGACAVLDTVKLHHSVADLPALMNEADVVLAMGGYNTVYEALSRRRRLAVFPRTTPRAEQFVRARRLEELGLVVTLSAHDLASPKQMALQLERAGDLHIEPADVGLRFDGARRAARTLLRGGFTA